MAGEEHTKVDVVRASIPLVIDIEITEHESANGRTKTAVVSMWGIYQMSLTRDGSTSNAKLKDLTMSEFGRRLCKSLRVTPGTIGR